MFLTPQALKLAQQVSAEPVSRTRQTKTLTDLEIKLNCQTVDIVTISKKKL